MATDTASRPITAEEFLEIEAAAGEDAHLELINGEIREYPSPMTTRSPRHSTAIAYSCHALIEWLAKHRQADGEVAAGEARCRITSEPDNIIGIDVAYFEGTPIVEAAAGAKFYDGAPVIAVEILSPSDTHEEINSRIRILLDAGVRQVWVADPDFRTITVHRSGSAPRMWAAGETLNGDPDLPGFACPVENLFGRPQRR